MKTLAQMMDKDLAGFQLTKGYFLDLAEGSTKTFPAIISETEQVVVCLQESLIMKVWKLLPAKRVKVTDFLLLVNTKDSVGFDVQNQYKGETPALHVLSEQEFNQLTKHGTNPFRWARV